MTQKRLLNFIVIAILGLSTSACSNNDNSKKTENSITQTMTSEEKYLKGISAASLYEPLKQKGFKIDKQIGGDAIFVDCDRSFSGFTEHVRIAGDEPSKIIEIKASYTNYSAGKTNNLATEFLGFIATLPYDNANPEQAKKWVQENISKNSKTDIGGVTFEIIANSKNIRTLLLTPSK